MSMKAVMSAGGNVAAMSKTWKIVIVVGALLAVMGLTHKATNTTIEDLGKMRMANSELRKLAGGNEEASDGGKHEKLTALPKPMGKPGAPVIIKVYITSDNDCDTTTLSAMETISDLFKDKVFIKFVDLNKPEAKKEADKLKIGCKTGIAINGKTKFILPGRGLKGAILLDGPVGQKNYDVNTLKTVVEYLVKEGAKGG